MRRNACTLSLIHICPAYQRWATIYNLKQMAAAVQYLQEHGLMDYAVLELSLIHISCRSGKTVKTRGAVLIPFPSFSAMQDKIRAAATTLSDDPPGGIMYIE